MKHFSCEPWAAFALFFFTTTLHYSCSAAHHTLVLLHGDHSNLGAFPTQASCSSPCIWFCSATRCTLKLRGKGSSRRSKKASASDILCRFRGLETSLTAMPDYNCALILAAAEDISNVSASSTLAAEYEAPCLNVNFCAQAAVCCRTGVDDYGWIAAAVGWSLWFLTLILLCMDKLMNLRPDEPKYLAA